VVPGFLKSHFITSKIPKVCYFIYLNYILLGIALSPPMGQAFPTSPLMPLAPLLIARPVGGPLPIPPPDLGFDDDDDFKKCHGNFR
jgi:hypothetical protein